MTLSFTIPLSTFPELQDAIGDFWSRLQVVPRMLLPRYTKDSMIQRFVFLKDGTCAFIKCAPGQPLSTGAGIAEWEPAGRWGSVGPPCLYIHPRDEELVRRMAERGRVSGE